MKNFENKTVLITGGTRGIGKAIALRLAREGANIVIVGKTAEPNPKLEGTIYTAAEEITAAASEANSAEGTPARPPADLGAGPASATPGKVLPLQGDIRYEDQIRSIVDRTIAEFGQIDVLVNNASAINIATTELTEVKRYDLIQSINVRGTFLMCQACIPHLKQAHNPHILNLSPPLNLDPRWFAPHLAYTLSKYGMSMIVLGLAEELKQYRIAANALWPRTTIATAAVKNLLGGDFLMQRSRTPEIVADAAFHILRKPSFETTGNFFIDEDVLKAEGVSDFGKYAVNPDQKLMNDLFL